MKKLHWAILAAIAIGLVLGASIAATIRATSRRDLPRIAANSPTTEELIPPEDSQGAILLDDRAQPGGDFYEFRERLREAVKARNAEFVKSLIPDRGLAIGFSVPQSREDLNLDDRNARLWSLLEKAVAIGCTTAENPSSDLADAGSAIWVCPNVAEAFAEQFSPPEDREGVSWQLDRVVVVGENVNVRSEPSTASEAIFTLSNQVVKRDRDRQSAEDFDPIDGWTPIILPDDRQGYVYNQFVYSPLDYRAEFGKVNGNWQLLFMPGGD